jgi:hypothetical protein
MLSDITDVVNFWCPKMITACSSNDRTDCTNGMTWFVSDWQVAFEWNTSLVTSCSTDSH